MFTIKIKRKALRKLRTGDLRIVYQVFWNEKTVLIHYIGPREKAYE